jgi:hypothetical protein
MQQLRLHLGTPNLEFPMALALLLHNLQLQLLTTRLAQRVTGALKRKLLLAAKLM